MMSNRSIASQVSHFFQNVDNICVESIMERDSDRKRVKWRKMKNLFNINSVLFGCWGSDTTKRLHFPFSLPCTGEGNGNPLQCSCLENPRDGGAWWAAIYGVAQNRTRLKWLSRSSSTANKLFLMLSHGNKLNYLISCKFQKKKTKAQTNRRKNCCGSLLENF